MFKFKAPHFLKSYSSTLAVAAVLGGFIVHSGFVQAQDFDFPGLDLEQLQKAEEAPISASDFTEPDFADPNLDSPTAAPPSQDNQLEELSADDLRTPDFLIGEENDPLGLESDPGFNLEKSKIELLEEARRQAFEAAIQSILPLRPNEIREMLEKFDRTQESVETPVYPGPKAKTIVQNIPLDPGTPPAVVKLAYGHVTTLSILDITGAPWPIEDISWAGDFEVTETEQGGGSHIIRISPRSEYVSGNLSMRLLTLKTPVILSLETDRDLVHYRFDAVIPEFGPLADVPLVNSGLNIKAGNDMLSALLGGVIPSGAERLNVAGVDGRTSAYRLADTTYVRTPLTLLSPSWSNSVQSADGTQVFVIKNSPVLLLSEKGQMVRARLSQREDLFDE